MTLHEALQEHLNPQPIPPHQQRTTPKNQENEQTTH